MMRKLFCIALAAVPLLLAAQVQLTAPLHLTGTEEERTIEGLALPVEATDLITVGFAVDGAAHWATAQLVGTTITLSIAPDVTTLDNGLLLRFLAPSDLRGDLSVRAGSAPAAPLLRPDGLVLRAGDLLQGAVCEVLYQDGRFTLIAPALRGCPPATLQATDRFCIDVDDRSGLTFFQAASDCAARGGRLCAWDEYYIACKALTGQLAGLFDDWEWMDDTANHAHTLGQVGRTTCMSQRSANPSAAQMGSTRCCYPIP